MASTVAAQPHSDKPAVNSLMRRLRGGDEVAWLVTLLFATSVLVVTALLIWELWSGSEASRHKFGFSFLTSKLWNPVTDEYGAYPFVYGTVVTSLVALVISVPVGVGAAIYLSELASGTWSDALTFLVELLAAVPSVIFGLMAIFTLVPMMRETIAPAIKSVLGFLPLFQGPVYGVGYLTASLVLSIMTFPYIISVSREALMAVPREQREAALALGATKWGIHMANRGALCAAWNHGSDFPGIRARTGRDDGCHHGDRQRSECPCVAVRAGLHDCRRNRQRI